MVACGSLCPAHRSQSDSPMGLRSWSSAGPCRGFWDWWSCSLSFELHRAKKKCLWWRKSKNGKKRDAQIGRLLQISVCIFWCQVSLVFFSCHFLRETFVSGVTSPVNESFNGRPWIGCYRGDSSNAWMLHSTLVGATGIATAWRCKQLADFYRRSVGACRCFPEKLKVLPKMKTDIFVV